MNTFVHCNSSHKVLFFANSSNNSLIIAVNVVDKTRYDICENSKVLNASYVKIITTIEGKYFTSPIVNANIIVTTTTRTTITTGNYHKLFLYIFTSFDYMIYVIVRIDFFYFQPLNKNYLFLFSTFA